jgi:hypothetical protein
VVSNYTKRFLRNIFSSIILRFKIRNVKLNKNVCKKKWGGGRNVDDQNVDKPKISERRNGLFSLSERRNQNVKNVF